MQKQDYITYVKAWLTPEGTAEVSPNPLLTSEVSPRLCKCGCGQELPEKRRSFVNKVCQGRWLGKHHAATTKTATVGEDV